MPLGTCKRWYFNKGFGFLTPDDGSGDIFCHITELRKSGLHGGLAEGDRVAFEISLDGGRFQAVKIRLDWADRDMA